jgi:hypothetical protein
VYLAKPWTITRGPCWATPPNFQIRKPVNPLSVSFSLTHGFGLYYYYYYYHYDAIGLRLLTLYPSSSSLSAAELLLISLIAIPPSIGPFETTDAAMLRDPESATNHQPPPPSSASTSTSISTSPYSLFALKTSPLICS